MPVDRSMDVIPARVIGSEPLTLDAVPDAAYDVTLHLGRWYEARGIELPLETRAEFARMAFAAMVANPDRATHELLDGLVAELDDMLGDIVAEPRAAPAARDHGDGPSDANWLQRLIRRRR